MKRGGEDKGKYNCIWADVREFPVPVFGKLGQRVDLRIIENMVSVRSWYSGCALFERDNPLHFISKFKSIPLFAILALEQTGEYIGYDDVPSHQSGMSRIVSSDRHSLLQLPHW